MVELRGHTILIVEPEVDRFILQVQQMLQRSGAVTMVARNPATAIARTEQIDFSGAVVNHQHAELSQELGGPRCCTTGEKLGMTLLP
jgi:hypothetical protein